jgi:hypothetical protein
MEKQPILRVYMYTQQQQAYYSSSMFVCMHPITYIVQA